MPNESVMVPTEPTEAMIDAGRWELNGTTFDTGEQLALTSAIYRAMIAAAPSPSGEEGAVAWRAPNEVPETKPGSYSYRIVAVKRGHSGKVYSFGAFYLNAVPLWFEDDNEERPVTGWHGDKEGDDGPIYEPLLGPNDELMAWCEFPTFAHPPRPQVGREEVARDELIGALKSAFIAGAQSVHDYSTTNPGEAPGGDPEFGEAGDDYAASEIDAVLALLSREGK